MTYAPITPPIAPEAPTIGITESVSNAAWSSAAATPESR